MLLAHIADPHLGYRAYHRLAAGGVNARERDVSLAFRAAIDRTIELEAELVLVAGDVFHTVRPSNAAIADAFRQFARLREALPESPVVVIAGNHDAPRSVETGSILRLLREIRGVHVMDDEAGAVRLPELGACVFCVPHNALLAAGTLPVEPDSAAGVNILMLHGTVTGEAAERKIRHVSEYGGAGIDAADIAPDRWDYVALGHYHIATELAPNMWYAGGTERTSTNIWEEAAGEKGFLTYDTDARRARFHPLPTREVVDLPRVNARAAEEAGEANEAGEDGPVYLPPDEIDARIRGRVEAVDGGIAGKIVRLVLEDIPRELFRELDHGRIREYRAQALHFHLDARRPRLRRVGGYGETGRRRTLEEEVEGFLGEHWQPSSPGVERPRLVALARRYLSEAATREPEDPLLALEAED